MPKETATPVEAEPTTDVEEIVAVDEDTTEPTTVEVAQGRLYVLVVRSAEWNEDDKIASTIAELVGTNEDVRVCYSKPSGVDPLAPILAAHGITGASVLAKDPMWRKPNGERNNGAGFRCTEALIQVLRAKREQGHRVGVLGFGVCDEDGKPSGGVAHALEMARSMRIDERLIPGEAF